MSKTLIRARWIGALFVCALFSRQIAVAQTSSQGWPESGDAKAVAPATLNAKKVQASSPAAPATAVKAARDVKPATTPRPETTVVKAANTKPAATVVNASVVTEPTSEAAVSTDLLQALQRHSELLALVAAQLQARRAMIVEQPEKLEALNPLGLPATAGAPPAVAAPTEPVQQASAVRPPTPQTAVQVIAPRQATPAPLGPSGRVNKWLSLRGEFRGRLEGFSGGAYKPDNSDGYLLDRFRIDATVAPITGAKFVVQLQDARAFDKTTGATAVPLRDTLDLRLAYGELGGTRNMVRAGRQELVFGEQRLIGHVNWVNNARSFDGVRATIVRKPFKFDAFATSVVTIQPDAFDKSGAGNRLYGFYGSSTTWLPKATVEPYVFYRQSEGLTLETGGLGDINQTTLGARVAGKLPRDFDYGVEMAAQTGSVATDTVHAWAGHWLTGKTFNKTPSKPRPFIELNYASGDRDPRDGVRGTFDQLYPTGHDKLGLADQVGWKNVEHLRGGIELKPNTQWLFSGSYHSFWLASATDALYGANGAAVARSAAGTAGRFVGQELDAQAVFTYSPQLQIAGGYGHVLPGEFLKNTTPGESYSLSYLMVTYVFMGGRPAVSR